MNADGSNERRLTTTIHCLQCGPDWASLPPHSHPSVPAAAARGAEPRRKQKFSRVSMTRTRFVQPSGVWVRFRAAVPEKVGLTIRRAVPPGRAFRCGKHPGACLLTGQGEPPSARRIQPDITERTAGQRAHPRPLLAAAQFLGVAAPALVWPFEWCDRATSSGAVTVPSYERRVSARRPG